MKYKVDVITFCCNEMPILPWAVDYWKRYANHVYVFDDGSTDGSKAYLKQFDFITVIEYETLTKNKLNDIILIWLKNNMFKLVDSDFVIVCDMDECIYFNDIDHTLDELRNSDAKAIRPIWCNMITEEFPEYIEGRLFHEDNEWCTTYEQNHQYQFKLMESKVIIFDKTKVNEIKYFPGAHVCNGVDPVFVKKDLSVYCFHLRYLSLNYVLERKKKYAARMSDENRRHGYAAHHLFDDNVNQVEFDYYWSIKKNWKDIDFIH